MYFYLHYFDTVALLGGCEGRVWLVGVRLDRPLSLGVAQISTAHGSQEF